MNDNHMRSLVLRDKRCVAGGPQGDDVWAKLEILAQPAWPAGPGPTSPLCFAPPPHYLLISKQQAFDHQNPTFLSRNPGTLDSSLAQSDKFWLWQAITSCHITEAYSDNAQLQHSHVATKERWRRAAAQGSDAACKG